MISAWWLVLIIPVSALFGIFIVGLVAGGVREDMHRELMLMELELKALKKFKAEHSKQKPN